MRRMEFQRARNEEQKEQRRQLILQTAKDMLSEMPVLDLSLNELSRRVGLAKSNVLRYFETREAVLLELLSLELQQWASAFDDLPAPEGISRQRGDHLAVQLADTIAARPLMCDLASVQAAVLERNVSVEVVLRHKRSIRGSVEHLAVTIVQRMPELNRQEALQIISIALLMTSAAWPHSTPANAVLEAYKVETSLADLHLSFADYIRGTLEIAISGIIARRRVG